MKNAVLFVSPDVETAQDLAGVLEPLAVAVDRVTSLDQADRCVHRAGYQVVVTEAELPDGTWRDMLRLCSSLDENPAVVVTSAHADARLWVDAVDAGASDVLAQPFDRSEVCRVVRAAIEEQSISASA